MIRFVVKKDAAVKSRYGARNSRNCSTNHFAKTVALLFPKFLHPPVFVAKALAPNEKARCRNEAATGLDRFSSNLMTRD